MHDLYSVTIQVQYSKQFPGNSISKLNNSLLSLTRSRQVALVVHPKIQFSTDFINLQNTVNNQFFKHKPNK